MGESWFANGFFGGTFIFRQTHIVHLGSNLIEVPTLTFCGEDEEVGMEHWGVGFATTFIGISVAKKKGLCSGVMGFIDQPKSLDNWICLMDSWFSNP